MNLFKPFLNLYFNQIKLKNNTIKRRFPILSTFLCRMDPSSSILESFSSQLFLMWETYVPSAFCWTRMTF